MLLVLPPPTPSPQLIGPLYTNVTYLGAGPFIDFYFICRLSYQQSDDDAMFDVVLTFDSRLSNVMKTTTSSSLDVIFTSHDLNAGFGTTVCLTCYAVYSTNAIVLNVCSSGPLKHGVEELLNQQ